MRLYCITRKDLTHGQKTAQLCHAATQYLLDHPDTEWNNGFIICLEAKDEDHLWEIKKGLEEKEWKHSHFLEPDFDDALTSISALDSGKLFANLPLMR